MTPRPVLARPCETCGTTFQPKRWWGKYCSVRCRQYEAAKRLIEEGPAAPGSTAKDIRHVWYKEQRPQAAEIAIDEAQNTINQNRLRQRQLTDFEKKLSKYMPEEMIPEPLEQSELQKQLDKELDEIINKTNDVSDI